MTFSTFPAFMLADAYVGGAVPEGAAVAREVMPGSGDLGTPAVPQR